MKLSEGAVEHPRIVLIGTILVLLLALYAAVFTPVQRTPAITKAVVLVAVPYPDSQPAEAENEIARKIEDALNELQSVDFIASTNMRGSSVTQIIFLDGVKPDDARREVKDLVDRIRNELPLGREVQPIVTDIDFENMPLMLVNIEPPPGFDERALKTIAEDVQEQLETVDGVANTQLFGGKEREVQVNIYPDRMAEYGVTLAQVRQALADFHAEVPAGAFTTKQFDRRVRNETKLRGVDDIREAIVSSQEGRVIRVSVIAEVLDSTRKVLNASLFDGAESATIIINKEADINTLGAARGIKSLVESLEAQYPDLKFSTTRDASEEIWVMFRVLGSDAVYGSMLLLVILMWTMGLRLATLVLIAVPFSTAVALQFLYFSGIPISNMVIFSFILALGMVVDGAIIVTENIHRHLEMGKTPAEAAKIGVEEVGVPVIAADLTTVAAYAPMLLVPGIMGDFMGVMPKVVGVALLGSIIVDHFVVPALAARWFKQREAKIGAADDELKLAHLGWLGHRFAGLLRFAVRQRFAVIGWGMLSVAGAVLIIRGIGFDFFPASDRGQFTVNYELPLGYSIEETIAAAKAITEPLEHWRDTGILAHYVVSAGSSGGLAMRIDDDAANGPEFGQVQVELIPPMDRNVHQDEVIQYLRDNVRPLPGMSFNVQEVQDGPPGGADVAVRFSGKDLDKLGDVAQRVTSSITGLRGVVDAKTDYRPDSPELVIEPKPEVLGLFGMTDVQIATAVQTAIAGDNRIQITLDDEDVDLRIQLAPEYQRHPEDLRRLKITGAEGRKSTIGSLAEIRRDVGLFSINRRDRNRVTQAQCNVNDPTKPDDIFKVLATETLPAMGFVPAVGAEKSIEGYAKEFIGGPATAVEGLHAEFAGENDERDKNFRYLLYSMIIAVVLIFAILVVQFNSFRQSSIVMVTVPLSFIGVACGMLWTGYPFSLSSFIGLVSLSGVVVNDATVLVDFINRMRSASSLGLAETIIGAAACRLRPVLLTTLSTVGGLLPVFFNITGGAEFWQPLSTAIIFGLSFATVLTLVFVPCCYAAVYLPITKHDWLNIATITIPSGLFLCAMIGGLGGAPAAIGFGVLLTVFSAVMLALPKVQDEVVAL